MLIEARNAQIEIKLDEAIEYTRDIKNGLKDDITRIERVTDSTSARVKDMQSDIDERLREVSELTRETEKDVRDTMRDVENRIEADMEKLEADLEAEFRHFTKSLGQSVSGLRHRDKSPKIYLDFATGMGVEL